MSGNQDQDGLPASHLLRLVALTKRWRVDESDLFADLPLRREDLADPHWCVPVPKAVALVERARTLTREPAIGLYMGLQMSASAHGYLGFAAMSAPTLAEALALAVQFAPIRTTTLSLHFGVTGPTAALRVDERADFGGARDVLLIALLVGIWQIGNALLGREVTGSTVHLQLTEPSWYAPFRDVPPRVLFGQASNLLVFDASLLDTPLSSADPGSFLLAKEQCEKLLDSRSSRLRLIDRVRRLALRAEAGIRSFDELATAVHVSPRTLRRRLAEQGISYSTLIEEERRNRAVLLLRSPGLPTKEVAERLGYSNVANFMRAFRRWTGQTPGAFRHGHE